VPVGRGFEVQFELGFAGDVLEGSKSWILL